MTRAPLNMVYILKRSPHIFVLASATHCPCVSGTIRRRPRLLPSKAGTDWRATDEEEFKKSLNSGHHGSMKFEPLAD